MDLRTEFDHVVLGMEWAEVLSVLEAIIYDYLACDCFSWPPAPPPALLLVPAPSCVHPAYCAVEHHTPISPQPGLQYCQAGTACQGQCQYDAPMCGTAAADAPPPQLADSDQLKNLTYTLKKDIYELLGKSSYFPPANHFNGQVEKLPGIIVPCSLIDPSGQVAYKLLSFPVEHTMAPPPTVTCALTTKSKKRRCKELDDQPYVKKPRNAFMVFLQEERPKVLAEMAFRNSAAVNKILGQRWTLMSDAEKSRYYLKAEAEKQLHAQQHPEWSCKDNYGRKRRRDKKQPLSTAEAIHEHETPASPPAAAVAAPGSQNSSENLVQFLMKQKVSLP